MFPDFGGLELLLILVVSLLVLGPDKLPEAARSVARWTTRWRLSFNKVKAEIESEIGMDEIRRELHNEEVMREISRIENEVTEFETTSSKISPPEETKNGSSISTNSKYRKET